MSSIAGFPLNKTLVATGVSNDIAFSQAIHLTGVVPGDSVVFTLTQQNNVDPADSASTISVDAGFTDDGEGGNITQSEDVLNVLSTVGIITFAVATDGTVSCNVCKGDSAKSVELSADTTKNINSLSGVLDLTFHMVIQSTAGKTLMATADCVFVPAA